MTLTRKIAVLAVGTLVGFLAVVMANHLHPIIRVARTPNLREYLWFLGCMLLLLVLAIPLARRYRSARATVGLGAGIPAVSVWIIVEISEISSIYKIHGLVGVLRDAPLLPFAPLLQYFVLYGYIASIIAAGIAYAAVKQSGSE